MEKDPRPVTPFMRAFINDRIKLAIVLDLNVNAITTSEPWRYLGWNPYRRRGPASPRRWLREYKRPKNLCTPSFSRAMGLYLKARSAHAAARISSWRGGHTSASPVGGSGGSNE